MNQEDAPLIFSIDVGGYEFNLNEDLINNYQIGEHVTLYLYGKGCSISIKKAERIVPALYDLMTK